MIAHQRHHHHGNSGSGGADHAGATTRQRNHHGDADRGVEPHARIDAGNDRKADGLRDKGEGDDDAGKDILARVGQPVTLQRGSIEHEL